MISRNSRVAEILKWANGPDVLHVGCADHIVREDSEYWLHSHLVNSFPNVVGIDISETHIVQMKERGFANVSVADAETFKLEEKFDSIIAGELIEHLSNPGLFLAQAKKHLKPGGRLIITTPFPFSLLNLLIAWSKYPETVQNDQHSMWFCVKTFRTLLSRYGFNEKFFSLIPDYEFDNSSKKYRVFVFMITHLGFLFPKMLKYNDMLFVLE